ncbi:hypothetical protein B484DRAFT_472346, partial [Ochromonadaceae sp. CCMP2298]
IQALRILDTAFTNDDDEEDETMMKNCKALAALGQHEGTVHDCYSVLGLPFLSSSTTAAARVNGDNSSELDAENNGTEWKYSPAPIAQANMQFLALQNLDTIRQADEDANENRLRRITTSTKRKKNGNRGLWKNKTADQNRHRILERKLTRELPQETFSLQEPTAASNEATIFIKRVFGQVDAPAAMDTDEPICGSGIIEAVHATSARTSRVCIPSAKVQASRIDQEEALQERATKKQCLSDRSARKILMLAGKVDTRTTKNPSTKKSTPRKAKFIYTSVAPPVAVGVFHKSDIHGGQQDVDSEEETSSIHSSAKEMSSTSVPIDSDDEDKDNHCNVDATKYAEGFDGLTRFIPCAMCGTEGPEKGTMKILDDNIEAKIKASDAKGKYQRLLYEYTEGPTANHYSRKYAAALKEETKDGLFIDATILCSKCIKELPTRGRTKATKDVYKDAKMPKFAAIKGLFPGA